MFWFASMHFEAVIVAGNLSDYCEASCCRWRMQICRIFGICRLAGDTSAADGLPHTLQLTLAWTWWNGLHDLSNSFLTLLIHCVFLLPIFGVAVYCCRNNNISTYLLIFFMYLITGNTIKPNINTRAEIMYSKTISFHSTVILLNTVKWSQPA